MRGIAIVFVAVCLIGCGLQPESKMSSMDTDRDAHPDFLRKLADPAAYVVNREVDSIESICGEDDKQWVNDYDGTLGQTKAFVKLHKFAVGALARSGSSRKYCSGALVGPDLFLTAGHCVDSSSVQDQIAMNYERRAGSSDLKEEDRFEISELLVDSGGGLDWALLRIEGSPGLKWGWTTVRNTAPTAEELITMVQHPRGGAKQVEVGHFLRNSGNYMRYGDLDTEPGSSGSAVVDAQGNVFGVHTNGGCSRNGGSNSGTRLEAVSSDYIDDLVAIELPFADGDRVKLRFMDDASRPFLLAGDVDTGTVTVIPEDDVKNLRAAVWTVNSLADGSFRLSVSSSNGDPKFLDGRTATGTVQLVDEISADDLGYKWKILAHGERIVVRTVGNDDGDRWLGVDQDLGLRQVAFDWQVVRSL